MKPKTAASKPSGRCRTVALYETVVWPFQHTQPRVPQSKTSTALHRTLWPRQCDGPKHNQFRPFTRSSISRKNNFFVVNHHKLAATVVRRRTRRLAAPRGERQSCNSSSSEKQHQPPSPTRTTKTASHHHQIIHHPRSGAAVSFSFRCGDWTHPTTVLCGDCLSIHSHHDQDYEHTDHCQVVRNN